MNTAAALPWVSIVTPAHNQGKYLRATMESVLAQDYPALEYLVVDDGSSDDSLAVAQAVAAEHPGRVTVITQPNAGQAATLNRAWAMCRGEILGYLSSDDLLLPGAISTMVAALQAGAGASVAYCDNWLIDAAGCRLRAAVAPEFDKREMLEELICAPGVGALFRRQVFDATGGWDISRRQVPDFEFWLRAVEYGDFLHVPQRLAEYRIHEGSASFKVMPVARAEEILVMVKAHWFVRPTASSSLVRRSIARAYCLAGKNHAQSGRAGMASRRYLRAFVMRPALFLEPAVWRQILVGFLRRTYFGWRTKEREQ